MDELKARIAEVAARLGEPGFDVRGEVEGLAGHLEEAGAAAPQPAALVDEALVLCRKLHAQACSNEALPLGRAAYALANRMQDTRQMRRTSVACGLLCSDVGDVVAAVEYQLQALRIATRDEDRLEMSRIWNNIGVATSHSGNIDMAAKCYLRALALVEPVPPPQHCRFAALSNLTNALFQLGRPAEGLHYGERSLAEMTPAMRAEDPYGEVLLRRNIVRVLVALGRAREAEEHVQAAAVIAERTGSKRIRIVAEIARATLEVATGRIDIALTRLDKALAFAREVPAALQDALTSLVRAEEAAGKPARALIRLEELSQYVFKSGIDQARRRIESAGLREVAQATDEQVRAQARRRLISKLAAPAQPEGWKALQRLGVTAVMALDGSGMHGMRVGALTKALAAARGIAPLHCVEIGLAAEVHDIGLISVPREILANRGPLSDGERAVLQRHVDAGAQMLEDGTHPRMLLARDIAKYHHAHWDGSGYPARVGGEQLPLAARMCAIADAYDNMVCGVGERRECSMAEALDELRRCAGTEFDPELVATFVELIHDESEGLGLDLASGAGMGDFHELVVTLKEDRGFA